jgi:hypothetical protein
VRKKTDGDALWVGSEPNVRRHLSRYKRETTEVTIKRVGYP